MTGFSPSQFQSPREPLQYPPQYQPSQPLPNMSSLQPRFVAQPLNDALAATMVKGPIMSRTLVTPPASDASPSSTSSAALAAVADPMTAVFSRASSQLQTINDLVTTPYDYTEGYHFLMKHLPTRCVL
jgi:hypothetical protein